MTRPTRDDLVRLGRALGRLKYRKPATSWGQGVNSGVEQAQAKVSDLLNKLDRKPKRGTTSAARKR